MPESSPLPEETPSQPAAKQGGPFDGIIVLLVILVPMLGLMWWYFGRSTAPEVVQDVPAISQETQQRGEFLEACYEGLMRTASEDGTVEVPESKREQIALACVQNAP